MNKKAQLDKLISFVPVFLIVLLIMGVSFFVNLTIAALKAPALNEKSLESLSNAQENLLLKKILIDNKETILLDAIISYQEETISIEEITNALKTLLIKEKNCIVLAQSNSPSINNQRGGSSLDDIYLELEPSGNILEGHTGSKSKLINQKNLSQIQITLSQNLYISYYHGGCNE